MEAGAVHVAGGDVVETADRFHAGEDADQGALAGEAVVLGGGQHGGDDHGADTDQRALQGVVEVLAVDRDAVDQRGTACVEGAALAERGAGAVAVRSEGHTSEHQYLMRIPSSVFSLKK